MPREGKQPRKKLIPLQYDAFDNDTILLTQKKQEYKGSNIHHCMHTRTHIVVLPSYRKKSIHSSTCHIVTSIVVFVLLLFLDFPYFTFLYIFLFSYLPRWTCVWVFRFVPFFFSAWFVSFFCCGTGLNFLPLVIGNPGHFQTKHSTISVAFMNGLSSRWRWWLAERGKRYKHRGSSIDHSFDMAYCLNPGKMNENHWINLGFLVFSPCVNGILFVLLF